jgi:VanZ family protein
MMTSRLLKAAAWLSLLAIIVVTVSPIGFRPPTISSTDFDRAAALAVCAGAFVLAYPQRWTTAALLMVLAAFGIEALQYLSPTRHPHLMDASVKAGGALAGAVLAWLFNRNFREIET